MSRGWMCGGMSRRPTNRGGDPPMVLGAGAGAKLDEQDRAILIGLKEAFFTGFMITLKSKIYTVSFLFFLD